MIRNPIQTLIFTFTNNPVSQIRILKQGYPKGPQTVCPVIPGPVKKLYPDFLESIVSIDCWNEQAVWLQLNPDYRNLI